MARVIHDQQLASLHTFLPPFSQQLTCLMVLTLQNVATSILSFKFALRYICMPSRISCAQQFKLYFIQKNLTHTVSWSPSHDTTYPVTAQRNAHAMERRLLRCFAGRVQT